MPPWSKKDDKPEPTEAPTTEGDKPEPTVAESGGPSEEELAAQAEAEKAAQAAQAKPAPEPGSSITVTAEALATGLHATSCDVSGAADHPLEQHSGSIVRDYRERAERLFLALS